MKYEQQLDKARSFKGSRCLFVPCELYNTYHLKVDCMNYLEVGIPFRRNVLTCSVFILKLVEARTMMNDNVHGPTYSFIFKLLVRLYFYTSGLGSLSSNLKADTVLLCLC